MDTDIQQFDALFHVYCALCATFKVLQVVFSGGKDEHRVASFVRYVLLLAFHSFRLRACSRRRQEAAAAMSGLLRWETAFFLVDEGFHLVLAAHDFGTVLDVCTHGIPTMTNIVRSLAALALLAFHALFLGPRSSLASDAAVFFGDMQFHFFHMLLATWQLLHYLWTTKKREARTYVLRWFSFIFHTGIVWFYTGGIQVSIRMQFVGPAANPPAPPPMPPAPNPEAVMLAVAAARAAEIAAARVAAQHGNAATSRRGSGSRPLGNPMSHFPPLTGSQRDVDRELGPAGHPCSSPPDSDQGYESLPASGAYSSPAEPLANDTATAQSSEATPEARPSEPEDRTARALLGSVTQTSFSPDSSTMALVPYVERPRRVESTFPSELRSDGQAAWDASLDPAISSISAAGLPAAVSTSEPATNGARSNIGTPAPVSAAETTFGGSSELVLDLAESSVQSPTLVPKGATVSTAAQNRAPSATSGTTQDSAKPGPSREPSPKPSPRTSRKPSSATPPKSPK